MDIFSNIAQFKSFQVRGLRYRIVRDNQRNSVHQPHSTIIKFSVSNKVAPCKIINYHIAFLYSTMVNIWDLELEATCTLFKAL